MKFVREFVYLPTAISIDTDSGRRYTTPDGVLYPSITTVLGDQPDKKQSLDRWRAKIGVEKANQISTAAAKRGSNFHSLLEQYLDEQEVDIRKEFPITGMLFNAMRRKLEANLDKIYAIEAPMYSDRLRLAGRSDLIGSWRGSSAIIDFKTSTKRKKREWITDYFLQATAYSIMFEEHSGIKTNGIVVLIASDDGHLDCFEDNRDNYIDKLLSIRDDYEMRFNINNE